MVRRKNEPLGWALPGGFVDVGETVEEAVVREAYEETGLSITDLWLIGVYSNPNRDPRFHTVSIAFGATSNGMPKAGDDAAEAVFYSIADLPKNIVFDHKQIIQDFHKLKRKRV